MAGAGYYRTDKGHVLINDTVSGAPVYNAGTDSTTVTLGTGGLAVDAEIGDLCVNTSQANDDGVITDNNAGTIEVNGDKSAWANGNNLTIDAFDTIQDAIDELEEEQAGAAFAAEQVIEVFTGSGAYNEIANFSFNFAPKSRYRLVLQAASGNTPVISMAGLAYAIYSDSTIHHLTFSGFTISGAGVGSLRVLMLHADSLCTVYSHLTVTATGYSQCVLYATGGMYGTVIVKDSSFTGTGIENFARGAYASTIICRRCAFENFNQFAFYNVTTRCESCTFDTFTTILHPSSATGITDAEFLNCVFYNFTTLIHDTTDAASVISIINCIVHTVTNVVNESNALAIFDGWNNIRMDRNCYHAITNYLNSITDPDITTFANWQARGYDANSQETDPLMTNPGAGDFTLQATSPCKWAGAGAGVPEDIAGVAFDPYSPDQGSHSSGLHIKVVQPRW